MSDDKTTASATATATAGRKAGDDGSDRAQADEAPDLAADPRPVTQIEAEEGARDGGSGQPDPALRAADVASARAYAKDGIMGAPGSEVPAGETDPEIVPVTGVRPPSQVEAEAPVRGDDGDDDDGTKAGASRVQASGSSK